MLRKLHSATLLSASIALLALCGCSTQSSFAPSSSDAPLPGAHIQGMAHGGLQPIKGATVQLYAVGTTSDGGAATALLTSTVTTATTGNPGSFSISTDYTCPTPTATPVYITITGGDAGGGTNNAILLMAALGPCSSLTASTFITINEVTTVAAAYALAPFTTSATSIGSTPIDNVALASDFLLAAQYANSATGSSPGLSNNIPANKTVPSTQINTIADILFSCINSNGSTANGSTCGTLFSATNSATNTFAAALYLALNPTAISSQNSSNLYGLVTPSSPYSAATSQPADWTAPLGTITTSPLLATGDTRTVTQPTYPALCTATTNPLIAQFPAADRAEGSNPAAASDDTARVQAALTACANTGTAVELSAGTGLNNSFFTGLITATGVGLIIDSGVTLFGNDQYIASSELIDFKGANSSIMGPGTVDGRSDVIPNSGGKTPRLVEVNPANGFIAYNVTLMRALHPALYVEAGNGITIWNVTIRTPANQNSADGIDIDSSTNVTATNNSVAAGDDGIAVKTNSGNVTNVTIQNNRLYGTHGLTVGSIEANTVQNILFQNNYVYGNGNNLFGNATLDDSTTKNAINIKVEPCVLTVTQVTYLNTCITTANLIIRLYDNYMTPTCTGTPGAPVLNDIVINGVLSTSSGSSNSSTEAGTTFIGNGPTDLMTVYLANVKLDATAIARPAAGNQYSTIFLDNVNFTPSGSPGTGLTNDTTDYTTTGSVPVCAF